MMKFFLHNLLFLAFFLTLPAMRSAGQSSANYAFSRTTTGSLVLDDNSNTIDMTTGQTTLIANNVDDGTSAVTNIGFDFVYMGNVYTQFYANSNGYIGLGGTTHSSNVNDLTQASAKIIAPFWDDLRTDGNVASGVFSKLVGTAPNRCLVVQFTRMNIRYTSGGNDGTYQVRLYETTGIMQFVYGSMRVNDGTVTASIGFTSGNTDNSFMCLTTITTAPSTTTLVASEVTDLANAFVATTNIVDLHNNTDGTRRRYTFTPIAAPTAPTALTFSGVTHNAMTLNWTDNATTETGYVVYRSTDNITFTLQTATPLATNSTSYAVTGLTPSTTYYWRVYAINEGRLSTALSGSQATLAPPSPTNDNCAGATTLTHYPSGTCTTTTATVEYATQSQVGCTGTADDDVWFQFVATSDKANVKVTWSVDEVVQIFSGACGGLSSLVCQDTPEGDVIVSGLTNGVTYFVRVHSAAGTVPSPLTFAICVTTPIANDDCAGAITLTHQTNGNCTTTSATVSNATQSQTGCTGTANDDVWFQFIATSATADVKVTWTQNEVVQIFSGACGSLTSLVCQDTPEGSVVATGLTVGATYYVRVYDYSATVSATPTFTICVSSPPNNDNCTAPTSLTHFPAGTCTTTNATVLSATQTLAGCTGTADDDVWFSFVATSTGADVQVTWTEDEVVQVFSGACGSLASLVCQDTPEGSVKVSGLTVGTTYFVRVYSYSATTPTLPTFTICVTTPATPTAPSALNIGSITASSMALSWTDNATNETAYQVYRSDDGGTSYVLATTLAANATTYTPTGLAPSFTYYWRVFAVNNGVFSTPALQGNATTLSLPAFTGNYDVPGAYSSLTNAGGIFEAMNAGMLTGNVTITIKGNLTETGTHALNSFPTTPPSGNFTITIQSDGTTRTISGTAVATDAPMIHFNGADRVTINGGAGKHLVFRNTNATSANTGATIQFSNTATSCTLTNCIIENNSTDATFATVMVKDNTTDANSVTISNCTLRDATAGTTGRPAKAFLMDSPNSWIKLDNNQIFNFTTYGVDIFQATIANACEITNNHVYETTTATTQQTGIAIQSAGSSGHIITGNFVGGNAINAAGTWTNSSNTTFTAIYMSFGSASATNFSNNTVQNITLSGTSTLTFRGVVNDGASNTNINALTMQNILISGSSSGTLSGVQINTNPTTIIQNSTFTNLSYTNASSTGGSVRAIYTNPSSTGDATNIQNNTFSNILSSSGQSAGSSTASIAAIYADSGTENITISGNTIYNIQATHATANSACYGIFLNNSSVNSNISRNRIYGITNVTTNTGGRIGGIYAWFGTFTTFHNQITITNGSNTNDISVYGIWEATTASVIGTHYYNSVYIGGSASTGSNNSYAYLRDSFNSTVTFRNNIFVNARTNTGGASGKHYVTGSVDVSLTNWVAGASNYNFFANSQTANVATWTDLATPSSETFATWKTNSAGDANSWYAQVTTGTSNHSNVNPSELFTDIANGDLTIKANNAASWFANGKGIALSNATYQNDFGSATAVRSAAVSTGGTDLGSDEFTPTVAPIPAKVTGTIGAGNTQTFEFAGRTIFTLYWKTGGTLPSSLGAGLLYYSGEWPRFPNGGARYFNAYWRLDPVGGTGYSYDVSLGYDVALIGTILSEAVARLSKQPSTATSNQWYTYIGSASSTNTTAKTVDSGTDLTSFSDFTASDDSAPLPVSLASFEAKRQDANLVELKWQTVSEVGLLKIAIEKSPNATTFQTLAYQDALNKYTGASYQAIDREGQATYYRLRFIFDNGQVSYSPIEYVAGGKPTEIVLYPNPMRGQVSWKVSEEIQNEMHVSLQVTDATGTEVGKWQGTWNDLADKLSDAKERWKTGLYILRVQVAGKAYILKAIR